MRIHLFKFKKKTFLFEVFFSIHSFNCHITPRTRKETISKKNEKKIFFL